MPRPHAIGRAKNARKLPSALIIELKKFCSSIGPSTIPRMVGATGNPLSSMHETQNAEYQHHADCEWHCW